MKRTFSSFSKITALLVLAAVSCTSSEDIIPTAPGGDVSYAADIQPIFNANCTSCHSASSPLNGVNLASYAATMASTGTSYGTLIVVAGNANASPLVDKIEPSPERGSRMPQGGVLSADQIAKIKKWINDGAANN